MPMVLGPWRSGLLLNSYAINGEMRNDHLRCRRPLNLLRSLQIASVREVLRAAVGDQGFRRDPCLLDSGELYLCAPWMDLS